MSRLAIVTATLDFTRAKDCIKSWYTEAAQPLDIYVVRQASEIASPWERWFGTVSVPDTTFYECRVQEILGVVPAFALGIARALADGAHVVAALHDDLEVQQSGWDEEVLSWFRTHPQAGLLGFGGGRGLGASDIYQTPYNPMQLARQDFISNMRDAEAHGRRVTVPIRVACLDGFSQVGTADFWMGLPRNVETGNPALDRLDRPNLFARMQALGVVHHFYDGMLGCYAKRLGYEVWMLPIACHHFGGRTAVGDARYLEWSTAQRKGATINGEPATGDQIFWREAHRVGYTEFKDVLPIVAED